MSSASPRARSRSPQLYGAAPESAEGRYSPADCTGIKKTQIEGTPDLAHVSTSYVERANLTMRMHNRRFTRLTDSFSKKFQDHAHMVALYAVWYNFCRIHKSLRVSPAMVTGVADRLWSMKDVAEMVEAGLPKPGKRGAYQKRGVVKAS